MQQDVNAGKARFDEAAALAALGGDLALLRELASMFVEDAPLLVADIRLALDTEQASEVRRAVHSLKGLVSTFYAAEARDLAERFENDAAALRLDSLKSGGVNELERAVEAVIVDLRARGLAH